ncbi:MAG: hypothetical protein WD266_03200 [Balneolales bacterium]
MAILGQTGEVHQAQVVMAIMLPASMPTFRACQTQQREDVVGCINGCLSWMGGVP